MQKSFERLLVEHCAPTLAGVKPGSLFRYGCQAGEDLETLLSDWNRELAPKGIRLCLLCTRKGAGLIYVYRPVLLGKILSEESVRSFLGARGFADYPDPEAWIYRLRERFLNQKDFPHEIGIFLGYPIEDVKGFIENQGRGYSLSGMWKVYGDRSRAEQLFARYRKCRDVYKAKYDGGREVTKLVVAS